MADSHSKTLTGIPTVNKRLRVLCYLMAVTNIILIGTVGFLVYERMMETAETRNECSQNIEQGNESLLHTADQAEDAIEKNIKTIGDLINNTAEHTMKILSEKESLNATFVLDSVMNILDEMRENNGTILKEMEALKSGVASVKTEVVNVVEQTLAKMNDTFGDIINYVTEYTGKEIAQICNIYNSSKHDYMISILEDLHYCWGDRVC